MKSNIHPLQSPLWANFRRKTGLETIDVDGIIMTLHSIPHTKYKIGYVPKGPDITQDMLSKLYEIGLSENCIFIQLEPNVKKVGNKKYSFKNLYPSFHPLLTKYTFILDLTLSEDDLLKNMHPKTRYNIRLAEKKGVKVKEDNSDKAFENYIQLTRETTQRQNFYAHGEKYHRLMWETLKTKNLSSDNLSAHLLTAKYKNETLAAWILFILGDTLYYPYGASSNKQRDLMASNLMMWEAIKFGKKLGLKKFDMWGSLGPNPSTKDPFYGFHRFKQGYGPKLIEYLGSYDFVLKNTAYNLYKVLDKVRWFYLKFR